MSGRWWGLWLVVLLLGLAGGLAAACGSDDAPVAADSAAQAQVEVVEQAQAEEEGEVVGPQPPEAEPEEDQGGDVSVVSVVYHEGIVAERNVLGDPDAPVLIMYFGDFQ